MRFSLKLLILLIALFAAVMAWVRARQEYTAAQAQIFGNTDWHTEYIAEADGKTSSFEVNAIGEVQSARLAGPAGYAALKERPDTLTQVWGLSLTSMEAFSRFNPQEFPNLKSLSVDDLDYNVVSFSGIKSLKQLQRLTIDARTSNPLPVLASIPEMPNRLHLNLRTDQVHHLNAFPHLNGVSTLVLDVPGIDEATLDTICRRMPECNVLTTSPISHGNVQSKRTTNQTDERVPE